MPQLHRPSGQMQSCRLRRGRPPAQDLAEIDAGFKSGAIEGRALLLIQALPERTAASPPMGLHAALWPSMLKSPQPLDESAPFQ